MLARVQVRGRAQGVRPVALPGAVATPAGRAFPVSWGVAGVAGTDLSVELRLGGDEPAMVALG